MPDIHPLAELFPSLEGDAFDALVADIKANGLHNCITLYDGKVLDGQNRLRACEAAGVEPLFDQYDGDDPLGFVMSMNVARRHLSVEQRSEVIRKLRELPQWREASNVAIAQLIGVSEATVRRAELSSSHDEDAPRDRHTITVKRGEQEYRMRVEAKPTPELVPLTFEDSKRIAAAGQEKLLKESDRYREKREAADVAMVDGALAWFDKASTDRRLSFIHALVDKLTDAERARVIEALTGAKVINRDDPDGPIFEYPQ
jgi:hypothetical protein